MPSKNLARQVYIIGSLVLIIILLIGCGNAASGEKPAAVGQPAAINQPGVVNSLPAKTATAAPAANESPLPAPSPTQLPSQPPTPSPVKLLISSGLPEGFLAGVKLPAAVHQTDDAYRYDLLLGVNAGHPTSGEIASSTWVYALVAPFPTLQDEVSLADLKKIWKGEASPLLAQRLLVTENTLNVFQHYWGKASPGMVQVVGKTALLETAWKDVPPLRKPTPTVPGRVTPTPAPPSPPVLAIIPFEQIEPRWKVLRVDGQSPLEPGFDPGSYALGVFVNLETAQEGAPDEAALRDLSGSVELPTNYDPSKLTTLVMTGTTAISRHIGERMEEMGLTYPAEDIRDWLAQADLTHISNEVSFYTECPKPGPLRADMRFCSSPRYIQLLEYVDANIIELTGNHNLDWGYQPFLDSLAMYQERGWKTYGGGADLEKAKQPLLVEHNGNRLAFLGCSRSGPAPVWATQYTPGSAPCDLNKLEQQVRELRANGYLPIVTFQAAETDMYQPAPAQGAPDFRRMARAGAVVVSGSQSHVPQTMTLVDNGDFPGASFVHYGLGNLFFDQMKPPESREEFIDRHVFYDGRYLGAQLLTALLEDYSRPRPMSAQERRDFLRKIFALCNWKDE